MQMVHVPPPGLSLFGPHDDTRNCHVTHYIYRSLDYLSITLRYSGLFGLVCNLPIQRQVITGTLPLRRNRFAF
ncbi:hypothetical protein ACN42_g2566 [Penicillium freii]|uniref:Uncharacterized protein n=1 Tax=Penicillium freii TaxID=48697 RepID=A0A101MPY3_PENFR|nr:hypothetical protein ACN42_g2566 [Penicillium freii]